MKIIAVAMQKGGVGKSMLSKSLSVEATRAGLNAMLIDMDAQQSSSQWADRRESQLPLVRFSTEIELPKILGQAKAAGCDLVIIDTPPARSTETPAAVEACDLVIVPCSPDIEAYEQLPRTVRLARTTGKPAVAVLTLAQPNSRSEPEIARQVFETVNISMAPTVIHRFKAHKDASREGLSVAENEPDSKAAAQIRDLWKWISAQLQL